MTIPNTAEWYFRAALGMIILKTVLVTGFHRYKAAQSGVKISRREEGYLFAVVLRSTGLVLFVATFAYLISPTSVQWAMISNPNANHYRTYSHALEANVRGLSARSTTVPSSTWAAMCAVFAGHD
jgi:hypothetical protein